MTIRINGDGHPCQGRAGQATARSPRLAERRLVADGEPAHHQNQPPWNVEDVPTRRFARQAGPSGAEKL